ncbi:hypothetical protein GPZ74_21715, partial [Burkholderia pseudomallei]|nr:hypothetical protein [Burkholderia pseudomallei]
MVQVRRFKRARPRRTIERHRPTRPRHPPPRSGTNDATARESTAPAASSRTDAHDAAPRGATVLVSLPRAQRPPVDHFTHARRTLHA